MELEKYVEEVDRLKAMECCYAGMTAKERLQYDTALRDAHWRLRMAMRREEEVKLGIIAPG